MRITKEEYEAAVAGSRAALQPTFDESGNLCSLAIAYSPGGDEVWASWKLTLDPEKLQAQVVRQAFYEYPEEDSDRTEEEFQDFVDDWVDAILEFGGFLNGKKCNFCYKTQKEVSKLINGPGVCICDQCVGVLNDINEPVPGDEFYA